MRLAERHDERVQLGKQGGIGRQMSLHERARLLVAGLCGHEPMASEDAPRVGVGDEDGTVGGVEQDGVGGLGTEPGNGEELASQGAEGRHPQAGETSSEALDEPPREGLEPTRLQPVRARGPDHLGEGWLGEGGHAVGSQQAALPEGCDGAGGVRPRGVLGEDGAGRDLVRSTPGPPALGPKAREERDVKTEQPRLDGIGRRAGLHPARALTA